MGMYGPRQGPVYTVMFWQFRNTCWCFTGADAWGIAALFVVGGAVFGAILGAGIGFVLGLLAPVPEPLTKTAVVAALTLKGIKAGAIVLGLVTLGIILASMCTCPGWRFGFCLKIIAARFPGTNTFIPVAIVPCKPMCAAPPAGLVPPGCP